MDTPDSEQPTPPSPAPRWPRPGDAVGDAPPPRPHGWVWPPAATPGPIPETGAPRRGVIRRRIITGVALALIAALVATVVGFSYAFARLRQIRRIAVQGISPVGPSQPQTILLTGSDTRAGESAAAAQQFGSAAQVAGQRSDVIILLRLNPGGGKAAMLSIPRDLFVPIAGTGASNRINTAFDAGPTKLIQTITQDFGITINHYAQEDFTGLEGIASAVGGVCMFFPYPVRDGAPTGVGNESGLNIPTSGRHTLNGPAALSLVRSRYYQYYADGQWHAEGTGDIGRIERQHEFMRALASKAIHKSLTNPLTANAVLTKAVHNVTVDSSFTAFGMARLGLNLRSLRPSAMPSWTLPYRAISNYRGYGDVLLPDTTLDAQVIAAWKSSGVSPAPAKPTTATVDPASVTVSVLNGSGVTGQAANVASSLRVLGFHIANFATAPSRQKVTTITFASGSDVGALAVASRIRGPVAVRRDAALTGSVVVLTTGSDFGSVAGPATATPSPAAAAPAAAVAASSVPPWDPTPC